MRGTSFDLAMVKDTTSAVRLEIILPTLRDTGEALAPRRRFRGWRRATLAVFLRRARRHWTCFYTVQGAQDEKRLRARGSPWPTVEERAHLGTGVYAWKYLSDARAYHRKIRPQRPNLRILRFALPRCLLRRLVTIDVGMQPDPGAWMAQYSLLTGNPNGGENGDIQ